MSNSEIVEMSDSSNDSFMGLEGIDDQEDFYELQALEKLKQNFFDAKREMEEKPVSASPLLMPTSLKLTIKRSRSSSPVKSTPKRSYKFLPIDEETGKPVLPIVLGRALNRINISEIGIIDSNISISSDGRYIYPIGYSCRRKYICPDNPENKINYQCSIQEKGREMEQREGERDREMETETETNEINGNHSIDNTIQNGKLKIKSTDRKKGNLSLKRELIFKISSQDGSIELESENIDQLWELFKEKFNNETREMIKGDFGSGQAFFGFDHDNLMRYLQSQVKDEEDEEEETEETFKEENIKKEKEK